MDKNDRKMLRFWKSTFSYLTNILGNMPEKTILFSTKWLKYSYLAGMLNLANRLKYFQEIFCLNSTCLGTNKIKINIGDFARIIFMTFIVRKFSFFFIYYLLFWSLNRFKRTNDVKLAIRLLFPWKIVFFLTQVQTAKR